LQGETDVLSANRGTALYSRRGHTRAAAHICEKQAAARGLPHTPAIELAARADAGRAAANRPLHVYMHSIPAQQLLRVRACLAACVVLRLARRSMACTFICIHHACVSGVVRIRPISSVAEPALVHIYGTIYKVIEEHVVKGSN
jgi:hypothetical protein